MRWVWGSLILTAVAVASLVIARSEATPARQLAGGKQSQGSGIASTSLGILSRNDDEGKILANFGKAPDFSLTERSSQKFSKSDLLGRPWIADFIFTSCAGQCPLMSLQMKKLQALFASETGFRFVSFTVDPDRDTPEVLARYADRYRAEGGRWFFLTGPQQEMDRILNGFFLSAVEQPAMHSIRFILVDGAGQIRGYYDSSDEGSMKQLIHDARVIARQQSSQGRSNLGSGIASRLPAGGQASLRSSQ
jgi:protein SCO1/2